jgi:hypothetical protein
MFPPVNGEAMLAEFALQISSGPADLDGAEASRVTSRGAV